MDYQRKPLKRGMASKPIPKIEDHSRFLAKISVDEITECWNWTGSISNTGYGSCRIDKNCKNTSLFSAHRVFWSIFKSNPTQGLVIDHMCRNRKCCNPDHLREVEPKTNSLENSIGICAINSRKTHCKRGHELVGNNIWTPKPSSGNKFQRKCMVCSKEIMRNRYYKLKNERLK